MSTAFSDVKPWPTDLASRTHNQPPIEERVVLDFEEAMREKGYAARLEQLIAGAARAPACKTQEEAGKVTDFVRQARTLVKAVEDLRVEQNGPILAAQRGLKGRADAMLAPLTNAMDELRLRLDAFMREEQRKVDEARRLAEEQRRAAEAAAAEVARRQEEERLAAIKAGEPEPAPYVATPEPVFEAPRIADPVVRGDMGARLGTRTVWKHKIDSVRQLPNAILQNERVIEALDKVIAAQIRGGTRTIKGCTVWSDQVADVR
jgi:hypothetical protein